MSYRNTKIRLFIQEPISKDSTIYLEKEHAHYLFQVMRCRAGDMISIFNGKDGQWDAKISDITKKQSIVVAVEQTKAQQVESDITLCFALVKNTPISNILQKATELGVTSLQPVITERTNVSKLNIERSERIVIEAAEQCERLTIPKIKPVVTLSELLTNWDSKCKLILCDESGNANPIMDELPKIKPSQVAILTGPEGGFIESEFAILREKTYITPVTMGPRILRADTAAIAALTCYQAVLGDWSK